MRSFLSLDRIKTLTVQSYLEGHKKINSFSIPIHIPLIFYKEITLKMQLDVDVSPPAYILYRYAGNYILPEPKQKVLIV